jgi:hypothetical protein
MPCSSDREADTRDGVEYSTDSAADFLHSAWDWTDARAPEKQRTALKKQETSSSRPGPVTVTVNWLSEPKKQTN